MDIISPEQIGYMENVSEGDAKFGFSMLPYLGEGNLAFSPYSIRTALAMVYEGARGETAKEISDVAHLPVDKNVRLEGYKNLLSRLNQENDNFSLSSANGLWVDNDFKINQGYPAVLEKAYQAQVSRAGFFMNPEFWRKKINEWVSEKTKEKIEELFPGGAITSDTVVALANALYFKGFWDNKFDPDLTRKQDFALPSGEVVKVDMMRKGEIERPAGTEDRLYEFELPEFNYENFDGFQVVMLPYEGHELAKVVMLPPKNSSTSELEEILQKDPSFFKSLAHRLDETEFVRLEIPKHEIRSGFSLNSPLQAMGIRKMFDTGVADLSGIGEGELFIGSGYHQAYFKTDEQGSEGAAATGFSIECLGISEEPGPVEFVVDRPFLEMIIHRPTNALLFLNRIVDPR